MNQISDVAKSLGVSTATVSRALRGLPGVSESTRRRVQAAATELGYVPSSSATGLATGRTMAMGVLLPVIESWYFAATLEGVDRELRASGYDLIVFNLGGKGVNRDRVFHRSMLRKRIDALLVMCMALTEGESSALKALDSPALIVGGLVEGMRCVSIDDEAAASEAVEYLVSLGHRKIGHLQGGGSYGIEFSVPRLRDNGFRKTMERHGLGIRPDWVVFGDYRFKEGKAAAGRLLELPERPTAIFADSDEMAFGVLLAAAERGIRVPAELSVIGIDDHEFADPMRLTTIRQSPGEQGAYGASLLLAELEGQPRIERPPVQSHALVIRGSTGPPPGG